LGTSVCARGRGASVSDSAAEKALMSTLSLPTTGVGRSTSVGLLAGLSRNERSLAKRPTDTSLLGVVTGSSLLADRNEWRSFSLPT